MIAYDEIAELADQLSPTEKARLIDRLITAVRQNQEIEAYKKMDWHEFIERMAGSLADTPLERPPQPPLEEREPIE